MARAPCGVMLTFLRPPPIPEVALGLWPKIFLGLARKWPARKVLSTVLGLCLAKCHLQNWVLGSTILDSRELISVIDTSDRVINKQKT